jgi:hypothetical protein
MVVWYDIHSNVWEDPREKHDNRATIDSRSHACQNELAKRSATMLPEQARKGGEVQEEEAEEEEAKPGRYSHYDAHGARASWRHSHCALDAVPLQKVPLLVRGRRDGRPAEQAHL